MTDNEVIQKVEAFIRHCHDLDYTFTPDSRNLATKDDQGKVTMLGDSIARSMSEYEWYKSDPENKASKAYVCLMWIHRAFAVGVVKEGDTASRTSVMIGK